MWFAVALDGTLITGERRRRAAAEEAAAPAPADHRAGAAAGRPSQTAPTELGDVLVDAGGLTLYGFTKDADGTPTCEGDCADAWPPLLVDGAELPAGLDPAVFSVVERADGSYQLKAGKWPLYRFAGDADPGETNGQGSGDVWFVVDPARRAHQERRLIAPPVWQWPWSRRRPWPLPRPTPFGSIPATVTPDRPENPQ